MAAKKKQDAPDREPLPTDALLAILERRGLRLQLRADGTPVLVGDKSQATKTLLEVLKRPRHRAAIMAKLGATDPLAAPPPADVPDFARLVECLWANGYRGPHSFPESGWPIGSRWWRYVGESNWRRIPGVKLSPIEPLGANGNPIPHETGDDA